MTREMAVLARLYDQNPEAFSEMIKWLEAPRHAFSITMTFHGRKLKTVEYRTTAGGKQENHPPTG